MRPCLIAAVTASASIFIVAALPVTTYESSLDARDDVYMDSRDLLENLDAGVAARGEDSEDALFARGNMGSTTAGVKAGAAGKQAGKVAQNFLTDPRNAMTQNNKDKLKENVKASAGVTAKRPYIPELHKPAQPIRVTYQPRPAYKPPQHVKMPMVKWRRDLNEKSTVFSRDTESTVDLLA